MIGSGRVLDVFANQFEDDGKGGFFFRRNGVGPAVRVGAAERDRFVEDYRRGWRHITWLLVIGTLVISAISIGVVLALDDASGIFIYVPLGVWMVTLLAGALLYDHRLRMTPVRALAGRPSVGNARSRDEAYEVHFVKLRWSHIFAPALGGLIALASLTRDVDMMHGWGRLWLLLGALMVLIFLYVAVRKWQAASGNPSA
ncbi:hypothetical protein U1839_18360 [Sphingomonas sp. RT2P30]|uniref:hypothetical protein n=1 Tax=Parasphingomonas halimpatiens TaxID=3096162 RepID=UPI002FC9281C